MPELLEMGYKIAFPSRKLSVIHSVCMTPPSFTKAHIFCDPLTTLTTGENRAGRGPLAFLAESVRLGAPNPTHAAIHSLQVDIRIVLTSKLNNVKDSSICMF